jgi:hypothetical protein
MRLVLAAERAEFLQLNPFRRGPLILRLTVIAVLTLTALELDNFTWHLISS